ncbi:50S ribosomal protein L24 [Ferrovibrio sp.]|uniref:50S ribosomal protein L24 n=1 Tax=Ferrovibrio sp. TaxID=1917215 RepID=UPI0025BF875C|nr:50S ribosomal protein L24 [Ferrovibrio sp.]MBX3454374.1 50S ribosomal protein L24 [Ferrovibrio sp.]
MAVKLKIKKGDKVVITTGRSKGAKGEVLSVDREKLRAIVGGVNKATRHVKPGRGNAGGIEQREASIHVSNLQLQDPKDGKPTRVGVKTLEDGRRVRVAKRSGEVIDR